ncbi:MAG: hypothetical protein ACTSPF_12165 [Candidatus Heimdallarchaeaceae archaeon]
MSSKKQGLEFEMIIGVKFLKENELPKDFNIIKNPGVRSYCDAVRLLNNEKYAEGLIVTKDSIKVCHWSPVCLGLKEPETDVQKKIVPLFDELNHGIFIFNIGKTSKSHPLQSAIDNPDAVTLVGSSENISKSVEVIGLENFTKDYIKQLELSAVSLFSNEDILTKKERRKRKSHLRSIKIINWLFASKLISNKKFGTGSCLCYGAAAIPYATQKANISFSDSGSIGWGGLSNKDLLLGLPYNLYKTLEPNLIID